MTSIRLPSPCLVILCGPSGSGKTTWADANFAPGEVVTSDRLRAMAGEGEHDQEASTAAFALLDMLVAERIRRGLTVVIDTLGLDAELRQKYWTLAVEADVSTAVIGFDVPAPLCKERNRARRDPVPSAVLDAQLRKWKEVRSSLDDEDFDAVHIVESSQVPAVVSVRSELLDQRKPVRSEADPTDLDFALHVSSFSGLETEEMGVGLAAIARRAEEIGFAAISVMDHLIQIPQVGPAWDPMLESYTTLGFIAAATSKIEVGTLVTAGTFRHPTHLAKIVATLDVLSGGRAFCGVGAGWWEKEHVAYGRELPSVSERLDTLEDTVQALRVMWGPGSKRFEGRTFTIDEAYCYPRPLQDPIPLLVGGSGEQRTLRIAAEYADACNLFGDPQAVAKKVGVLHRHLDSVGRDRDDVRVTHLSATLTAVDADRLAAQEDRLRPPRASARRFAKQNNSGIVADQIGRFEGLQAAGVSRAFIAVPGLSTPDDLDAYGPLIEAFR